MTDIAGAQDLPDAGSLQPPPDLPDVGSLTEAQTLPPMRGIAGMPSYSPAVVARLRNGDPVSRVIGKLADGFATGYGTAFSDITAEDQAIMAKAGYKPVTPEDMGTIGGTLRFFGHALMDDVSRVKAGVLSLFPAAVEAARQGVTQGAKEIGLEAGPGGTAEQAGEGAAGFVEFMGTDAGIQTMLMSRAQYAEATRIMPNPAGGHFDQRIGPVPDHVEAAQQAAQAAEHYGLDIAPAITEAYGKGVLPAEIHADAKTNPTILPDLAEGKVPEAYPVSDWTGGEPSGPPGLPEVFPAERSAAPAAEIVGPGAPFSDVNHLPSIEDIDQMIEEKGMSDDAKLARAFGSEERASLFNRLYNATNSSNSETAARADARMAEEFGELTPEQERLIYGIGEKDYQADDLRTIRDAVNDTDFAESDTSAIVAREAQRGLLDLSSKATKDFMGAVRGDYGSTDQAAAIRFARSYKGLQDRGLSSQQIDHEITKAMIARGMEPNDAADILGGIKEDMAAAQKPKAAPAPLLIVKHPQTVELEGKASAAVPGGPATSPAEAPVSGQQEGAPQPTQAPGRAVPTRLRPIEGTGELTPMQLSQSVEEAVGKEFEGVPASRVASNEVQEAAARKFVDLDPERADQVAMFGATPPKNLLGQMVYNEVVRRAAATGDFDKLRMLATQSTQPGILRRSGQEIQAASQLGDGNAAADMTRVHEARQAALKAQGVDVAANENAAAAEYAPIRAATRAAKGPDAWAKFLSAIQCAE